VESLAINNSNLRNIFTTKFHLSRRFKNTPSPILIANLFR
jgi:hypothetical protein